MRMHVSNLFDDIIFFLGQVKGCNHRNDGLTLSYCCSLQLWQLILEDLPEITISSHIHDAVCQLVVAQWSEAKIFWMIPRATIGIQLHGQNRRIAGATQGGHRILAMIGFLIEPNNKQAWLAVPETLKSYGHPGWHLQLVDWNENLQNLWLWEVLPQAPAASTWTSSHWRHLARHFNPKASQRSEVLQLCLHYLKVVRFFLRPRLLSIWGKV